VSGFGDDANPCSRTAPCKTFPGAISKTAAGGEINVIDPGGFGGITIAKSISIIASGVEAGILVAGTNGVTVNAPTDAVVNLVGLDIDGTGTGLNGVSILQAGQVNIRNCLIHDFKAGTAGIDIEPGATRGRVLIADTDINNNTAGILSSPSASTSFTTLVYLQNVRVYGNTTFGVRSNGRSAVTFNNVSVYNNATGIEHDTIAYQLTTVGNNLIYGNGANTAATNGSFSASAPLQ